jgi:hypothetical protein
MCIPASCEEEGAQVRRLFRPQIHSQRGDDIGPHYVDSTIALQLRKLHVTAGEQRSSNDCDLREIIFRWMNKLPDDKLTKLWPLKACSR